MHSQFEQGLRELIKEVVTEVVRQEMQDLKRLIMASSRPKENKTDDVLLTVAEAAKMLSISQRKLFTMTKNNEIPSLRVGQNPRYSVTSLKEWIRQNETNGFLRSKLGSGEGNSLAFEVEKQSSPKSVVPSPVRKSAKNVSINRPTNASKRLISTP